MVARVDDGPRRLRRVAAAGRSASRVGSIALALVLGYAISWSLIGPVQQMDARFAEIAAGDFSRRVDVPQPRRAGRAGRPT